MLGTKSHSCDAAFSCYRLTGLSVEIIITALGYQKPERRSPGMSSDIARSHSIYDVRYGASTNVLSPCSAEQSPPARWWMYLGPTSDDTIQSITSVDDSSEYYMAIETEEASGYVISDAAQ